MAKAVSPDKYAKGLFSRAEEYADKVRKHYVTATNALLTLSAGFDIPEDEIFTFAKNPQISAKANEILRGLYSAVYNEIKGGVVAEWGYANLSNDELIASIFGKGAMDDNHFAKWFSRNQDAMDAFFARKSGDGGLNLSQKVWKYTGSLKEEMELALSVSLGQGSSASTVSREVRQLLQHPDKLFRRVKDKNNNLKLSKAAKAYNPGKGRYRSSYKNAMRLTRTETNMAYRTADYHRWQQMDFVVGVRIQMSKQHPMYDICDSLQGDYPKEFIFRGWHPQCFCYATAILATEEEMIEMQKKLLAGEDPAMISENQVTSPPPELDTWIKDNQTRIDNASSVPYWIKDNYVNGDITKGFKFTEALEAKNSAILKTEAIGFANDALALSAEFASIDTSALAQAIKTGSTGEIKAQTANLKKQVSKATAEAEELYKEQPTEWGLTKEFGKESSDAFMKSWEKYTSQKATLSDADYLKVIEKEIFYGNKNIGKYATSEKMIYFLEKEKERILATIEQKSIISSAKSALDLAKITKSVPMKTLAKEFDDLVSSNASNSILKKKADELQMYYNKLEKDRLARLKRKGYKGVTIDDDAFSQKRKDAAMWAKSPKTADDKLRDKCGEVWQGASDELRKGIHEYTYTYHHIQEPLRGLQYVGSQAKIDRGVEVAQQMTDIISRSEYDFDMWTQRFDDHWSLKKFGIDVHNFSDQNVFDLVGKSGTEGGFWSVGVSKGKGYPAGRNFLYNVYCPRGTKMMYVEPFSNLGNGHNLKWDGKMKQSSFGSEQEAVIQRGTTYRVLKVEKKNGMWYIDVEVIAQNPLPYPYVGGFPYK